MDTIFSFSDNTLFSTVRRFVLSSGVATSLHWAVLWLLLIQGVDAVTANAIGALCGAIANYFLQFHFTFRCNARQAIASGNYIVSCGLGWLANSLLFALFAHILGMAVLTAQILVVSLIAGCNFLIYRYWVFNEQ